MRKVTRRAAGVAGALAVAALGVGLYLRLANAAPVLRRAAGSPDAAGVRVVVGPNVLVSASRAGVHHDGCTVAADPTDPRRLFAASMHWHAPGESGVVGYFSHDGGATWRLGCERLGRGGEERCCDEAVAFSPDGVLYLAHMRGTPAAWDRRAGPEPGVRTEFARSADGGRTWEERGALPGIVDRPQVAFDTTGGSFHGRLYCNADYSPPDRAYFCSSSDGAATFAAAALPDADLRTVAPSNPVVLADGTVVVAYRRAGGNATGPPAIPVWRSADGGRTFAKAGDVPTRWRHARARHNSGLGMVYPVLAADPRAPGTADAGRLGRAGRLYCVWVDGPTTDARYVLFSSSDDRGATWTTPVVVSEQPLGDDAAADWQAEVAAMAVNRDGVVAVTWHDRRGLPKSKRRPDGSLHSQGYHVRLRASVDGGRTWLPGAQLSEAAGRGDVADVRYWTGLAAGADGRFHAVWVSDATGVRQLWTVGVGVAPVEEPGRGG